MMMFSVCVLLVVLCGDLAVVSAQGSGCKSLTGPVVGAVFGTLAFVGIILGIVALVYWRKKVKDKDKAKKSQIHTSANQAHDNPTFVDDLEKGSTSVNLTQTLPAQQKHEAGFPGYVECREYESPVKNRVQAASNKNGAGPVRTLFLESETAVHGLSTRTGSRGSLDDSIPALEKNHVIVPLLSKDIMGLGFNVDGNMKEGIFVSKVHKRGPAHDAGLIAVGDRIMSVTVSFENMVLEDAMTILSYASPYPVKLCLRKVTSAAPTVQEQTPGEIKNSIDDEEDNINHPVYRSQSLDDLRQINREGLFYPRRTLSEMKKSGYTPVKDVVDSTNLRKWKDKEDMVQEESSESGDLVTTQSTASNFSLPDMKIDMADLRMDDDEANQVVEVHMDAESGENVRTISTNDVNVAVEEVDSKFINQEIGEVEISAETATAAFSSQSIENNNKRPHDIDLDNEGVISVESPEVTFDSKVSPSIHKKFKTSECDDDSDAPNDEENLDSGVAGMEFSVLPPSEKPPEIPGSPPSTPEDQQSDVIREYFGNSPSILEQFGLPSDGQTVEVSTVTSEDGAMVTTTETVETSSGDQMVTVVESTSEIISPEPTAENGELESPEVQQKAGEGTNFDLNSFKLSSLSREIDIKKEEIEKVPQKEKTSVAYYLDINDHGSPAHAVRLIGDTTKEDLDKPELIRPVADLSSDAIISSSTSINSYHTSLPDDTQKDVNDNSQTHYKPNKLNVQLVDENTTDSISESLRNTTESVTIIKQSQVPEAFTVTVTPEDSQA